jgi:transcriptional regulator with XRE-family HTH domain
MTGNKFKEIRKTLNISRRKLGKKLGVSLSTITRWEDDNCRIPKTTAEYMELLLKFNVK